MDDPHDGTDDDAETGTEPATLTLTVGEAEAGERLDKALAILGAGTQGLSRSRIAQALAEGRVLDARGRSVTSSKRKAKAGETYRILLPPPVPARPRPERIPLDILYEDSDIIVVDKPAGMVVHPAPGAGSGTLVNALLAHCGETLAGIGGERRPGIVHRIDKDTSGLIVVAKSDAALRGLAMQFAAHDIGREYTAVCLGVPDPAEPRLAGLPGVGFEPGGWIRIETLVGRHPTDRKRMAVTHGTGRRAVTRIAVTERFGPGAAPIASLLRCRLETGRTHQIRVHCAHIGHPLAGDRVYGRKRRFASAAYSELLAGFQRQALHASKLSFTHPVSGLEINFETDLPEDVRNLITQLRRTSLSQT